MCGVLRYIVGQQDRQGSACSCSSDNFRGQQYIGIHLFLPYTCCCCCCCTLTARLNILPEITQSIQSAHCALTGTHLNLRSIYHFSPPFRNNSIPDHAEDSSHLSPILLPQNNNVLPVILQDVSLSKSSSGGEVRQHGCRSMCYEWF